MGADDVVVEPLFQALLEAAPDAIVIIDESGRIALANVQAERMFGYARDALIGQPIEQLLPKRLRGVHEAHRERYIRDPRTRPMGHGGMELVARRSDDSEFAVEVSLSPLNTEAGLLVTSVIRDITDRKRAAEELERQVRDRTRHLDAVLAFGKTLLGVRSLDDVLREALNYALVLVPEAQRAAIYLVDEASSRLALRASTGFQRLPQMAIPSNVGLIGLAFTTRQTQIIDSPEAL
jgi:PAS domain S-box-containing protein